MHKASTDNRPKTVIFHHHAGIADHVWHLPCIRKIAEQSRGGKVCVVARPSTKAEETLGDKTGMKAIFSKVLSTLETLGWLR